MTEALVIGAGPAGLMAAETLAGQGAHVVVAEAMPTPARKFLMAGKSGLNLTKDESPADFAARFSGALPRTPVYLNMKENAGRCHVSFIHKYPGGARNARGQSPLLTPNSSA